jgi:two-component system, NarL family, nitrate/nitrite response regulator NarL
LSVRVLVADDHPVYRRGLVRAIGARQGFEVVGEADNGVAAAEEIASLKPDVAVLDVDMPERDGLDILEEVVRRELPTRVLLLTGHAESGPAYRAIAAGVAGYLIKTADRDTICDAIAAIMRGETVMAPEVQQGLAGEIRLRSGSGGPALSDRELEVLRLTSGGSSAKEIAERLNISATTVRTHLTHAYDKLGVSDRAAAVAEAMRRGLLE